MLNTKGVPSCPALLAPAFSVLSILSERRVAPLRGDVKLQALLKLNPNRTPHLPLLPIRPGLPHLESPPKSSFLSPAPQLSARPIGSACRRPQNLQPCHPPGDAHQLAPALTLPPTPNSAQKESSRVLQVVNAAHGTPWLLGSMGQPQSACSYVLCPHPSQPLPGTTQHQVPGLEVSPTNPTAQPRHTHIATLTAPALRIPPCSSHCLLCTSHLPSLWCVACVSSWRTTLPGGSDMGFPGSDLSPALGKEPSIQGPIDVC